MIKEKFFRNIRLSNKETTKIIYQLCMGMLGAVLVILGLHLYEPVSRIGTVNITGLVDQFVKSQAKENLSHEEAKKRVQVFGGELEKTMRIISVKQNLILLPSEAVITGAKDYTDMVQKHLPPNK